MIPTTHRLIRCCLSLALLSLGLISCGKDNAVNEVPDDNELASVGFFEGNPGKYRIELFWKTSDPRIEKAVIYWNNSSDSVVVPVQGKTDTMSVMVSNLDESNQSFGIIVYDDAGSSSKRSEIVARIYGDGYQQSLLPRGIQSALFSGGKVEIDWSSPEQTALTTEIVYTDQSGVNRQVIVPSDMDNTVLDNYEPGSVFEYRTAYLPEPTAIDTFYSDYASSDALAESHTFTNPLLSRGADPWVIYRNGMYYYTYTQGGGITLYATPKMSELDEATPVEVWRPPSGTAYSGHIWAPELHFIDNKWYVYFSARRRSEQSDANQRMYVIENATDDPMSKNWEFKGKIEEPIDQWAIDPTVLQYNGSIYLLWSGKQSGGFPQSIYIAPMSNPWTLSGSRTEISTPTYDWEENGAFINEGPQVLFNPQGKLFIIFSASGFWTDDYCLGMLSLRDGGNPLNPSDWTKNSTPVFTRNDQGGAYGPGHNSFFKSRDGTEDWIIYHARERPGGGDTNYRNSRMQKFTWNEDGTPDFGEPVPIGQEIPAPSGEF